MRIEVLYNYGSIQLGQRRIEPGVYEIDDPRLFGRGQYLVDNGHAVVIEGETFTVEINPNADIIPDGSTVVYFDAGTSYIVNPGEVAPEESAGPTPEEETPKPRRGHKR